MNASERLSAARDAAREGRYQEALDGYRWFHDHALAEQPAQYGVRLSFALSDWVELGELFPPARAALLEVLADKVARLRAGEHVRDLFHDVVAIHRELDREADSVELFRELQHDAPEFAATCGSLVIDAACAGRDYGLARSIVPDPAASLCDHIATFEVGLRWAESGPEGKADRRATVLVDIFANKVGQLLRISCETGDSELAPNLREQALAAVPETLRTRFESKLP